jgi:hypothetical protein
MAQILVQVRLVHEKLIDAKGDNNPSIRRTSRALVPCMKSQTWEDRQRARAARQRIQLWVQRQGQITSKSRSPDALGSVFSTPPLLERKREDLHGGFLIGTEEANVALLCVEQVTNRGGLTFSSGHQDDVSHILKLRR